MLESVQKIRSLPRVSVHSLASVTTLAGFLFLLVQDGIHPIFVYLLQMYLSF